MFESYDELADTRALVIEGNPSMRSILVAQMKDFGVGAVAQCGRIIDARRMLEYQNYDFVLCESNFPNENATGQDLLNDLRRNQLLPFSTVFVMITGEATYAKVAEAAESALDGYLLKPHKPLQLSERLQAARLRKVSLQRIFRAIEESNFDLGAKLCIERFKSRGPYWLYAARIGAELLLRLDRPLEAKTLYEAVIQAKTLPWAKLGVARSMLDSGQPAVAVSTLENLIAEDPSYTDAYDVMGLAQFHLGQFEEALATYKMASTITPGSISRMQNFGMMLFYAGHFDEAERTLARTALLGIDSKIFDCQSLVLMAFVQFDRGDHKALLRGLHDFERILERDPDNVRAQRLAKVVQTLYTLHHHKIAQALDSVRAMIVEATLPAFDFESASNLVALLAQLAKRAIQLEEVTEVIDRIGMRFCSSRAMGELLAGSASAHPEYANHIRGCNAKVLRYSQYAMSLSLKGDPKGAVQELILRAEETLNVKLVESAISVMDRYAEKIGDTSELRNNLDALRARCVATKARSASGEGQRKAGALSLRGGTGGGKRSPNG